MEIKKTESLSEVEYNEVVKLLRECKEHDSFEISGSVNLCMLLKSEEGYHSYILGYVRETLIGFLGLLSMVDPKKMELVGMVHPDYRNKGYFTIMMEHAKEVTRAKYANEVMFVCPSKSDAAKHLSLKLGAAHTFSEYTMQYNAECHNPHSNQIELLLQKAKTEEVSSILKLLADGFDIGPAYEKVKSLISRNTKKQGYDVFVVRRNKIPIATMTVSDEGFYIYLSGFTVTPEERGKGYGRVIMEEMIHMLINDHPTKAIRLNVDYSNDHALKLYEDAGFRKIGGYDYYLAK